MSDLAEETDPQRACKHGVDENDEGHLEQMMPSRPKLTCALPESRVTEGDNDGSSSAGARRNTIAFKSGTASYPLHAVGEQIPEFANGQETLMGLENPQVLLSTADPECEGDNNQSPSLAITDKRCCVDGTTPMPSANQEEKGTQTLQTSTEEIKAEIEAKIASLTNELEETRADNDRMDIAAKRLRGIIGAMHLVCSEWDRNKAAAPVSTMGSASFLDSLNAEEKLALDESRRVDDYIASLHDLVYSGVKRLAEEGQEISTDETQRALNEAYEAIIRDWTQDMSEE